MGRSNATTDRLPGEIVLSRADAPGDNHPIGTGRGLGEDLGYASDIVPHHHRMVDIESSLGQSSTDGRRVFVDDLSEQQLGAHRDDLDDHPTTTPSRSAPNAEVISTWCHSPTAPWSKTITPSISGASR